MDQLNPLLEQLNIPVEYNHFQNVTEADTIRGLEKWKAGAVSVLEELLTLVKDHIGDTSRDQQADIVLYTVPFGVHLDADDNGSAEKLTDSSEHWDTVKGLKVAEEILSLKPFSSPSRELVQYVLVEKLKPIFKTTPHPRLNPTSARSLPRAAGGPNAIHDYYENQKWKQYPGVATLVYWCVLHVQTENYEHMWHLLIPPVMTLLDDYEVKHKLEGVLIVRQMLRHVPQDLFRRTGVDKLISASLRNCLSHLDQPETVQLLKNAISTSVSLTLLSTSLTTKSGPTPERFGELSSLLGEGIIAGIWLYADDKPHVVLATFDALPSLIRALDIGTMRFLQALMPQLTHNIIPPPLVPPNREMQISALRVLDCIVGVCQPRIAGWKVTILDAVGRCWVEINDLEGGRKQPALGATENPVLQNQVKDSLKQLCSKLAQACPSAIDDYQRFLAADQSIFRDLFSLVSFTETQDHPSA